MDDAESYGQFISYYLYMHAFSYLLELVGGFLNIWLAFVQV